MADNKRRSFLRNTALGTLGLTMASNLSAKKSHSEEALMCDMTTQDYYGEGPFYTDNPPMIEQHLLAPVSEPGTRMIISGRVLNLDCTEYIPNAIVDVWHANNAGGYDNNGYNLRGFTTTNAQGFYLFETIKPGKYLNGSKYRPSHIHYKITPPDHAQLTTQLYFEGDEDIPGDAAASITQGDFDATNRIISLGENSEGKLEGTFDIIISGDGIAVGTHDLHIDKGMVYKATPNPFNSEVEINYGVFKKSKVGLVVYDMSGQQIAILEDEIKTPEKYNATWRPNDNLPKGHYFIALKINDLQVHYIKLFRS